MGSRNGNRNSKIDLGQVINEIIEMSGMMKKDIAKQLNISPSTLTGYISNNRVPDIFTLLDFCEITHIEPNQLFGNKTSDYIMNKKEKMLIQEMRKFSEADQQKIYQYLMGSLQILNELKDK